MKHSSLRRPLLGFALGVVVALQGQSQADVPRSAPLDPVQGAWSSTPSAANLKETVVDVDRSDASDRLELFRAERASALARSQGGLAATDRALLQQLSDELSAKAPNSFEAHLTRFYLEFPNEGAFRSLELARSAGAGRPELAGPLLVDAARRFDRDALVLHAKAMERPGQVAPGLWSHADDVLLSVDPEGILFAAGEMDAYPLWARQYADGKRPDVLVIDSRLLVDANYRRKIWTAAKAAGNEPGTHVSFMERLASATNRPVHLSLALGNALGGVPVSKLYLTGLAMRVSTGPIDNIPMLEERWARMSKNTACGPLGQNYLLPAAVLLKHYRSIDDEERASRLENEIRILGRQLGAMDRLYKNGVLEH